MDEGPIASLVTTDDFKAQENVQSELSNKELKKQNDGTMHIEGMKENQMVNQQAEKRKLEEYEHGMTNEPQQIKKQRTMKEESIIQESSGKPSEQNGITSDKHSKKEKMDLEDRSLKIIKQETEPVNLSVESPQIAAIPPPVLLEAAHAHSQMDEKGDGTVEIAPVEEV